MLHPWMLLGLAGLAVPVILHLIQRQRLRPQLLATLEFLDVEDAANAFAPVPRDWLQLLLRLLLLTLFILLMARMAIQDARPGPRTMAVVLDQSLSMQRKVDARESLFDRCRTKILALIDEMGPEDRMALVLAGDRVAVETGYLQDREALRRTAAAFEVSDGGGRALVTKLRSVVRELAGRRDANASVLVFSDHQASHFQPYLEEARGGDENPTRAFRDYLDRGQVKLVLVDCAGPETENLALEKVRFMPEQVYLGGSSRVTAVVSNHSGRAQETNVRVTAGQQAGKPRALRLEPGETASIDLVQRFETPEDSACRVEIDPDALPGDNHYWLPMRLRDRKQVLLVAPAGDRQQEAALEFTHRGADLLAYAMNPGEALGQGGGTAVNVKRISPAMLGRVSLPMYSVVVLYGTVELGESSARDLATYVRNGGGVWLVAEREVSPLRFNEAHAGLLGGLAIGRLKQADPVESLGRDEAGLNDSLFLPLLRDEWGDTRDIYFTRYHVLQSPGTAAVALRTAGGDPLAAVVRLGLGRVFVQLFDDELDSSSLPRTGAWVPLVQEVLGLLARRGGPASADVLRVGEVHHVLLPELRGLRGTANVRGPSDAQFPLAGDDVGEIRVEGLDRAGIYQVSHSAKTSARVHYLAVNPVLGESDLAPLGPESQAELFGTENVARLKPEELAENFSTRREIVSLLLLLVLVAMAVEALVGAWQARRRVRA